MPYSVGKKWLKWRISAVFLMFFCAIYMFYGVFFCGGSEIVLFFVLNYVVKK